MGCGFGSGFRAGQSPWLESARFRVEGWESYLQDTHVKQNSSADNRSTTRTAMSV